MYDRDSSPDYASSTNEEKPSAPRRIGGVRKIVGDPNYATEKKDFGHLDFDFGVTQSLTPLPSRPGTAAGRVSPLENNTPTLPTTPNEHRMLRNERVSPKNGSPLPSPQSRPSSRQLWHPALATGRQSPGGLTAEEFVQQRASLARLPGGYVTRRTASNTKAEEMLRTPPPEPSHGKRPSRPRPTSRPSSCGSLLDFSTNMSAREQEHVARMTGSPLLNIPDRHHTPDPTIGLIGAISAREQDRRNMKEGISSHLAQTAIAQRQQQAQHAYMHQLQTPYRPGMNAWNTQQRHSSYSPPGYYHSQPYFQRQPRQPMYPHQLMLQAHQHYGIYSTPQASYRQ